jgi:hypothetical protein
VSRTATIVLLAGALALVTGLVGYFALDDGSTEPATPSVPASPLRTFSLPLADSSSVLALGGHERNVLVGLVARPGGPVEIAAVRGDTPIESNSVEIRIDGRDAETSSCGRGCSRVESAVLAGSPARVSVQVGDSALSFALPARLPPDGTRLFLRARRTMDALRSLRFSERLTSGAEAVFSTVEVQAPDRLRLRTGNDFRSVIIGKRRWDYRAGHWEQTPFPGLRLPDVLMWSQAKHPRILGRAAGGVTELAAFGRKPVPAWFRLEVAPSGRVLEAEMIAESHFMTHRYSRFDAPLSIKPPAGSR